MYQCDYFVKLFFKIYKNNFILSVSKEKYVNFRKLTLAYYLK